MRWDMSKLDERGDAPTPERTHMNAGEFLTEKGIHPDTVVEGDGLYDLLEEFAELRARDLRIELEKVSTFAAIKDIELAQAKVERDERTPKDERAAFEEWYLTTPLVDERHKSELQWQAWQARAVQKEKP